MTRMKFYPLAVLVLCLLAVGAYLGFRSGDSQDSGTSLAKAKITADNSRQARSSSTGSESVEEATSDYDEFADMTPEELLAAMQQLVSETNVGAKDHAQINPELRKQLANKAFELAKRAAILNDKAAFAEMSKVNPKCSWCNDYYRKIGDRLDNPDLSTDEKAFLSRLLTSSGRPDSIQRVVDHMQEAIAAPEKGDSPSIYGKALEQGAPLQPDILDEIGQDLASENPYVREAIVSILTRQGTLAATERLYQHTVDMKDPAGYYRSGIGIGQMTPKQEALGYLETLASQNDQYSPLAVKALLNYGPTGIDKVVALLNKVDDPTARTLLRNATSHLTADQATVDYLKKVSQSSSQPAVKELAKAVANEQRIQQESRNKQIEYNEHFEEGLVKDRYNPIFQR